jgi:hypothetical protein
MVNAEEGRRGGEERRRGGVWSDTDLGPIGPKEEGRREGGGREEGGRREGRGGLLIDEVGDIVDARGQERDGLGRGEGGKKKRGEKRRGIRSPWKVTAMV